jgi:hypothetical protein
METSVKGISKILYFLLVFLSLSFLSACKKDDPETTVKQFDDISLAGIIEKESSLSASDLDLSNSGGLLMDAGTILFYKTSLGNYGKLEILSVDQTDNYKITLKAKTYSPDGILLSETTSLAIRGTWLCDLDLMTEEIDNGNADFWHERINATDSKWVAKNGALFFRYNP